MINIYAPILSFYLYLRRLANQRHSSLKRQMEHTPLLLRSLRLQRQSADSLSQEERPANTLLPTPQSLAPQRKAL